MGVTPFLLVYGSKAVLSVKIEFPIVRLAADAQLDPLRRIMLLSA